MYFDDYKKEEMLTFLDKWNDSVEYVASPSLHNTRTPNGGT